MPRSCASPASAGDLAFPEERQFAQAKRVGRILLRRPLDSIGIAAVAAGAGAIVVNALYLQSGPHPAPLRAATVQVGAGLDTTGSLIAMPRPRPTDPQATAQDAPSAPRARVQIVTDLQRALGSRGFYDGAIDGIYGPKMDAAIREFEQAAGLKSTGEPTEALLGAIARSPVKADRIARAPSPASSAPRRTEVAGDNPTSSARIAAIQRALADFGYGQIKPNGLFDGGTRSAIEKFERERKLPITGQISDRLSREISAVTGRPLE